MTLYNKIKRMYYIWMLRTLQTLTWKYECKLEESLLQFPKDFRSIIKRVDEKSQIMRETLSQDVIKQRANELRINNAEHSVNKLA